MDPQSPHSPARLSSGSGAAAAGASSTGSESPSVSATTMHAPLSADAAAFLRRQVDAASERSAGTEIEQLRVENEQLRGQVADFAGALKARDLEIAALRERCQLLLRSIEQQDETIAKIYAVASPATMDAIQRPTTEPKPPQATATKPTEKKKERSVSLVEPTRVSLGVTAAPTSMFDAARASLGASDVATTITKASGVLSEAIDRILHTPPPPKSAPPPAQTPPRYRRMSLFDDDTSTDDTSPSSCSSTLSKSSSGRAFDRRESCASEEDFVRSAGFLRKPSRRTSGRLSISDFGLLDDADTQEQVDVDVVEVDEDEEEEEEDEAEDNQREAEDEARSNDKRAILSRSKSEDFHKRRNRRASSSQRNLFADIDASKNKGKTGSKKSSNQDEATDDDEQEMTYAQFLERLRLPASRDILETIRTFLASILGPRGDGKPPRSTDFVDYEFYGTHEFRRRCVYFFQSMEELLVNHPLWRHASEATLAKARDGVEKYVMDKLEHIAMNQLEECDSWKQEDDRLLHRMKVLSFITPDMLDIKPCMRNEVVWSMAEDELRRINSFRSPGDKINCIVRCCSVIFSVLNLSRGESGSRPGADDFLPVFIYIVLHSKIPRLHSNCEYIAAYRNPNDLMSKAGYCFVNLRSAVEFLSVVDASMLSVSDDEFNKLYEREELKLLTATS